MRHDRQGLTLLELLIVIVMTGVLLALALPMVRDPWSRASVRSAGQTLATQLAVARSTAIHAGYPARLVASGDTLRIQVADSTGAFLAVGEPYPLGEQYDVTLTGTPTAQVQFDPRGFALGLDSVTRFVVAPNGGNVKSDTVCVARIGLVLPRGCTL